MAVTRTLVLSICTVTAVAWMAGSAMAQSTGAGNAPAAPDAKPGAVAYPNNPAGTPAASDKGAPVVTDKAACPASGNGRCPDSPAPSGSASDGTAAAKGSTNP